MTTTTLFKPAQRTQAKLRLAIDGPSGSGKTYSALLIAKGLAGGDLSKVALIDTERGSGSLYSDLGPYAVAEMHPPYSPKKFMDALDAAVAEGFEAIVIDSLSHAWAGEGGVLDYVDSVAKTQTKGNSFTAWKAGTKVQNELVDHILSVPCHVIATMRTKTEWVIEENEKGKKVPRKIGMAVKQRDDVEYEFTTYLNLSREGHVAIANKDRTGLFDERMEVPSEKMGEELLAWLASAAPVPPRPTPAAQQDQQREQAATAQQQAAPVAAPQPNGTITQAQAKRLHEDLFAKGRASKWFLDVIAGKGIGDGEHLTSIPSGEYERLLEIVAGFADPPPPEPTAPAAAPVPAPAVSAADFAEASVAAQEPAQEVAAPAAASDASETPAATQEAPAAQVGPAAATPRPDGCTLDKSFQECAAVKAGTEPDCGSCDHHDKDFAPLDAATRGDAEPAEAAAQPKRKKGTVSEPQLKRLGIQCAELEELGVGRDEWRLYMLEKESVASRTELTKAAATRTIDYLARWTVDIRTGVAGPGEKAVA